MKTYFNTSKQSLELFRCVVGFMAKHVMNPTPINYAVAYEYCMCHEFESDTKNFKFLREIEHIFEKHDGLDDISGLKLFRKHIRDVPEDPHDIIEKTAELPSMLDAFIDFATNYINYHISVIDNVENEDVQSSLDELNAMISALQKEIGKVKETQTRIAGSIDDDKENILKDVVTGLYADKQAMLDYDEMTKHGQVDVYILFLFIDGIDALKKKFGDPIEEGAAKHFVRAIEAEIPESLILYRWVADNGYLVLSHNQNQLESLAKKIKTAFALKELTHKFTKEKISNGMLLKSSVVKASKNLRFSVRSAQQRLKK